jgi:hypothetical protein
MSRKIKSIPPVDDTSAAYQKKADTLLASDTASVELKAKAQALKTLMTAQSAAVDAYNASLTESNNMVTDFNARVDAIANANKALTALGTQLAIAGTLHINDASTLGITNV